jgi:hypothetical protein
MGRRPRNDLPVSRFVVAIGTHIIGVDLDENECMQDRKRIKELFRNLKKEATDFIATVTEARSAMDEARRIPSEPFAGDVPISLKVSNIPILHLPDVKTPVVNCSSTCVSFIDGVRQEWK